MFLEDKFEGEPPERWPEWLKLQNEPILTTDVGVWFNYVVLPNENDRPSKDQEC